MNFAETLKAETERGRERLSVMAQEAAANAAETRAELVTQYEANCATWVEGVKAQIKADMLAAARDGKNSLTFCGYENLPSRPPRDPEGWRGNSAWVSVLKNELNPIRVKAWEEYHPTNDLDMCDRTFQYLSFEWE